MTSPVSSSFSYATVNTDHNQNKLHSKFLRNRIRLCAHFFRRADGELVWMKNFWRAYNYASEFAYFGLSVCFWKYSWNAVFTGILWLRVSGMRVFLSACADRFFSCLKPQVNTAGMSQTILAGLQLIVQHFHWKLWIVLGSASLFAVVWLFLWWKSPVRWSSGR